MRRTSLSVLVALTLLFAASVSSVSAASPGNDALANAAEATVSSFTASPDMSEATMEADELACDETGGLMDQSVWYWFTPNEPAVISIWIFGEPYHGVTAAVYGPFDERPTTIAGLGGDPRNCIYDTGTDSGLTEWYPLGVYLIQLTTVSGWNVVPTITMEQDSPPNNDVAYPEQVPLPYFEASPSMAWTWLEDNEPVCDETGDLMDQSVWYRVDLETAAVLQIEVDTEVFHGATVGVYGPFDEMPTSVDGLEAIGCVYDAGPDFASTEAYRAGSYLVQLTTVSQWGVAPSIRIQELTVILAPWQAGSFGPVTVPQGVGISLEWGWLACARGLATLAPRAIAQSYSLRMHGDEVTGLAPQDAAALWWGPEATGSPDSCLNTAMQAYQMRWGWYIDPLAPGDYELDVQIVTTQVLLDGTTDEAGLPARYPPGTSFGEGTFVITVPGD
jgi:hypothetical protein